MTTHKATTPSASRSSRRRLAIRLWRGSLAAIGWFPLSLIGVPAAIVDARKVADSQRRLAAYGSGEPVADGRRGRFSALIYSLFGLPLGALALFIALLAVPNTIRNVFAYGLTDGGDTETSWGGPTLAGAWAVHATLALAIFPIFVLLLGWLSRLQAALAHRLLGRGGPSYIFVAAAVFSLAGLVFFVAFLHQL